MQLDARVALAPVTAKVTPSATDAIKGVAAGVPSEELPGEVGAAVSWACPMLARYALVRTYMLKPETVIDSPSELTNGVSAAYAPHASRWASVSARQFIDAADSPWRTASCLSLFGFTGIERFRRYWPPLLCPATTPPTDPDSWPPRPNLISMSVSLCLQQHHYNTINISSNHYNNLNKFKSVRSHSQTIVVMVRSHSQTIVVIVRSHSQTIVVIVRSHSQTFVVIVRSHSIRIYQVSSRSRNCGVLSHKLSRLLSRQRCSWASMPISPAPGLRRATLARGSCWHPCPPRRRSAASAPAL